jgi:hypothetical protein
MGEFIQRQFGVDIPTDEWNSSIESALQPPSLSTERGLENTTFLGIVEGSENWADQWWRSITMDNLTDYTTYNPDSPAWVVNPVYKEPVSFDVEASINSWDIAIIVGILVVGGILAVKVL